MNQLKTLGILFVTAALVACGGGGGGGGDGGGGGTAAPAADAADKYAGTWTLCAQAGAASFKVTVVNSKASATSLNYSYKEENFATTNCSGTATPDYTEAGTITYKGTKTVGSDTVDLGDATITSDDDSTTTEPRTEKNISLVAGNTLYFGDDTTALDANGYPTILIKNISLTKQ